MKAFLQYTREERQSDTTVRVYSYYKLENNEWIVQSKNIWKTSKEYDEKHFQRIMTFPVTKDCEELKKYDYDIRDIMSENSIKDIEPHVPLFPVFYTYQCKWSGQYMTTQIA